MTGSWKLTGKSNPSQLLSPERDLASKFHGMDDLLAQDPAVCEGSLSLQGAPGLA